jgi:hypothetical protein
MKKIYGKLFGSENPTIAVAFMCIIYVAAHFFIKMGFNARYPLDTNSVYFTIDAPAYIIFELERWKWLEWVTLIVAIGAYMWVVIKNAGLGYSEGDKTFGRYFIAGGLIVIAGFFPAIFGQNKEAYRKKVDEKTFQYYKANPDKAVELFKK